MSKLFWNALKLTPVLLGATLLLGNRTQAAETPVTELAPNSFAATTSLPSQNTPAKDALAQVTSVSQLSDVQPTDWAFLALQSLVERYGCIAGYPDGTYRGNRALTRYEFAAGLNACLDRVNELIATATNDQVTREDLATLQRLQAEFSAELTTLRGRVDALEAGTAELEANQFSTTTKLNAEAIFAVSDVFGDRRVNPSPQPESIEDLDVNTTLSDRVRLNFDTSFTGKDLLRTRLEAANITPFGTAVTGTSMTRLSVDENTSNNSVLLSRLWYRFPVGDKASLRLSAVDTYLEDNIFTFNPELAPSNTGSLSRFGRFNPIYRQGSNNSSTTDPVRTGGAGLTFNYDFSKAISLSLGYLAPFTSASNPGNSFGLFNGSYAALAQLTFRSSNAFNLGLTYVHSYNTPNINVAVSGGTGSVRANQPFSNIATSSNQYGLQGSFRVSPKFIISGWGGLTYATAESGNGAVTRGDNARIFNYAVTLSFPDLGKEGNLGAIIFGQPPKVTDNDFNSVGEDNDTSYHLEGLYRYRLTDNIDITPGLIVIFNPEHNNNNDNIYVGTLRTTFRF